MKYSIIIPVYNREKTIAKCLEVILSTQYQDYEVIVVDDGSSDNSLSVCMEFSKKHTNVHVYTQVNKGVSAARNLGITKAQGEYILFIDSDDVIHPYTMHILDERNKDGVDIMVFNKSAIRRSLLNNIKLKKGKEYETGVIGNNDIIRWFFEVHAQRTPIYSIGTKIFKREIIVNKSVYFREDLSLGEDQVFICEYLQHVSTLKYVDVTLYFAVSWSKTYKSIGLGTMRRTADNFLYNQMGNYNALIKLYEHSGLSSVRKYAVCYILDRPITRIIFRNTNLLSQSQLSYRQLKIVIDKEIRPILMREYVNLWMVQDRLIKWYVRKIINGSYNEVLFFSYVYNTFSGVFIFSKEWIKRLLHNL